MIINSKILGTQWVPGLGYHPPGSGGLIRGIRKIAIADNHAIFEDNGVTLIGTIASNIGAIFGNERHVWKIDAGNRHR